MTRQEEVVSSCTSGILDWISGKISLQEGLSGTGTDFTKEVVELLSLEILKICVDVAHWQCWINGWIQ